LSNPALELENLIYEYENRSRRINNIIDFHPFLEARQKEANLMGQLVRWRGVKARMDLVPGILKEREEDLERGRKIYAEARLSDRHFELGQGLSDIKSRIDDLVNLRWLDHDAWRFAADLGFDLEATALLRSLEHSDSVGDLNKKVDEKILLLESEADEQKRIINIFKSRIERLKIEMEEILGNIIGKAPSFPEPQVIDLEEAEAK